MTIDQFLFSSPMLGILVTLGNLAIWGGLTLSVGSLVLYWSGMLAGLRGRKAALANTGGDQKEIRGKKDSASAKPATSDAELPGTRLVSLARRLFLGECACFVVAAVCLWALIFTQSYNVHYIWKVSNKDLAFGYRFASLWSDQEGTFILWGLYNTVLGTVFFRRNSGDERWTMPFFALVNVSLFTLLTFMNPFWIEAAENVRKSLQEMGAKDSDLGFLPQNAMQQLGYYFGWGRYPQMTDGKGLNESLQNFWMVIHPPTLFVGYSSMLIPSCMALGALMARDYDSWVHRASPWLTFGWTVLGTGIFLGAYWAYETLGWGGYWSWDPVENSSFVPWLIGTTLLHGMLAQRNRGNLKQANLFLGAFLGVSVLLGSFLVRSGVLSDTSVHSFASPQSSVFYTLLAVLILFFVVSMAIWIWRFPDIQSEIAYERVWERHFGFFLALISLTASALVIIFGVTLPIWQGWLPGAGGLTVDYTFYNKALLPVIFLMVLLMAITPLMPWKQAGDQRRPLKPFTIFSLVSAGLITIFFVFAAWYAWQGGFRTHNDDPPGYQNDPAYIATGLALALALLTNGVCGVRAFRTGALNTAPWVAHTGFVVMLAGVIITSRFNTTHSFAKIGEGEYVEAVGRKFHWKGQRESTGPTDRHRMLIEVEDPNGKRTMADPKLFVSKIDPGKTMAWPWIRHEWFGGLWGDLYVEPSGVDNTGTLSLTAIGKLAEKPTMVDVQWRRTDPRDNVVVTFEGLDTSEMQRAMQAATGAQPKSFSVAAEVSLEINGQVHKMRPTLKYQVTGEGLSTEPVPIEVPGLNQPTKYRLSFVKTNMDPSNLTADFELKPDEAVRQGYFQIIHVPGIQVLWFGCYIMIAGSALTWWRRRKLARSARAAATA